MMVDLRRIPAEAKSARFSFFPFTPHTALTASQSSRHISSLTCSTVIRHANDDDDYEMLINIFIDLLTCRITHPAGRHVSSATNMAETGSGSRWLPLESNPDVSSPLPARISASKSSFSHTGLPSSFYQPFTGLILCVCVLFQVMNKVGVPLVICIHIYIGLYVV